MTINNLNIIITTFSKRYFLLKSLIDSIRNFMNNRIVIVVNGEINKEENVEYINNIFNLCIDNNIIPIFFPEFRSLSKMWNTGCMFSNSNDLLVLNDDIILLETFKQDFADISYDNILLLNNSFSHFLIKKQFLDDIGYFEERFLGIGWEDADFCARYMKKYQKYIPHKNISSIKHSCSDICSDNQNITWNKYSIINRDFFIEKYGNYSSPWYTHTDQKLSDINPYPLESYFHKYKNNIQN
jgi:hypothetical protein